MSRAFQRVLVAGFVAGGSEDVDANQETVRLLRSQLRTKSSLKVIDADILPLIDVAQDQSAERPPTASRATRRRRRTAPTQRRRRASRDGRCRRTSRKKRISSPTSGCSRTPPTGSGSARNSRTRSSSPARCCSRTGRRPGFVQRDQEVFDSLGRRRVVPTRTYMERKGFILRPKFVFIDGRTGATMYSESYREEILYNAQQNTPALSSYFELMDRLVPELPQRAQQPEDPRHARAAAVTARRPPHSERPRSLKPASVVWLRRSNPLHLNVLAVYYPLCTGAENVRQSFRAAAIRSR